MATETMLESYKTESEEVPVTKMRPVAKIEDVIKNPGEARFNQAADKFHPEGSKPDFTKSKGEAFNPKHRSVLQQHCDFFDRNQRGMISPLDTYKGFRAVGFNPIFSIMGMFIINVPFSFYTNPVRWLPIDPLLRVYTANIEKAKHGSDSGTYDSEGRFIPQKFQEVFSKWDKDNDDRLNFQDMWKMTEDLRVAFDFFGWFAAKFEWSTLWLLAHDENGMVSREDIRGCFDGSLFYRMEAKENARLEKKKQQWLERRQEKNQKIK